MKIHWLSNAPWAATGYGNQTAVFVPRIHKQHPVSITAFYGLDGGVLNMDGVMVYPKATHPYGQDIAAANARNNDARVIISLMDSWVCDPRMLQSDGMLWAPWYPVDMEPLPRPIRDNISQAFARIAMSRFGERMTNEAGLNCYYVPHGVDQRIYRPLPRAEALERLHWPNDRFTVSMVAANQGNPSRKSFQQALEAFAMLAAKHDDAHLYLHTNKSEHGERAGVNLPEIVRHLGIEKHVSFPDQYAYAMSLYPPYYLCDVYNASDAHMLPSMGEGFGIPTLEAQACGCPVIVGDWTASSELCFSGWKIPKSESTPFWTPLAAYQYIVHTGALYERLEAAYQMRGNEDYRRRAVDGAKPYHADRVLEKYWLPVLADIEANINERLTFDQAVRA